MKLSEIASELYSLRASTDNLFFNNLEDEHIEMLSPGIFKHLTEKDILQTSHSDYSINPEVLKKLNELNFLSYFYSISRFRSKLKAIINIMDNETILLLMGMRKSYTSITDETGLPPVRRILLKSARQEYKEKLTVSAKALSKHANRSDFWGEVRGKTEKKNREAIEVVGKIIDNYLWWNKYRHSREEVIFEIRILSGHGCRWNGDGSQFIGFVEPMD